LPLTLLKNSISQKVGGIIYSWWVTTFRKAGSISCRIQQKRDRGRLVEVNLGAEQERLRASERDVLCAKIAEAKAELDRRKAALDKSEVDAKKIRYRRGHHLACRIFGPNDPIISIWDIDQVWMRA